MGLRRHSDQVADRVASANWQILDLRTKQRSQAIVVQGDHDAVDDPDLSILEHAAD